jgi:hypothetical protein
MRSGTYVATSAVILQLSYASATRAQTIARQWLWQKLLAGSSAAPMATGGGAQD